jgi:hypothetical protein
LKGRALWQALQLAFLLDMDSGQGLIHRHS